MGREGKPINLTKAQAAKLNIEAPDASHGAKTKADNAFGESICAGLVEQVRIVTKVEGKINFKFHPTRRWELDAAWPTHKIAVELQGHKYHKHRGKMEEDFVKCSAAIRLGWRVFYCSADQIKRTAALWVIELIEA